MLMKENMNIFEIAKKIAIEKKLPRADRYDLVLRDFDNMVELIGRVPDPTVNMNDFSGREMLVPKRWVTLAVLDAGTKVSLA
jgi:hypothetical protein